MRTVRGLVSKLSFTAVGLGAGLVLAAGSGVAAVHLTQTAAMDHSIRVIQPAGGVEDRIHAEDSATSGADDPSTKTKSDDPTEPAEASPEPGDDNPSKSGSADNSGDGSGQSNGSAARSPEPGDDHGRDGKN